MASLLDKSNLKQLANPPDPGKNNLGSPTFHPSTFRKTTLAILMRTSLFRFSIALILIILAVCGPQQPHGYTGDLTIREISTIGASVIFSKL